MARPTPLGVACAALAAVVLAACGPKLVRTPVFDKNDPGVRVELQRREKGGVVVPRGFQHPVTIADVRMAHILANVTYQDKEEARRPAIRSQFVYDVAAGIAQAFAKATPDDEVVAAVFPEDRKLGIFTDLRVTSFRMHLEGDELRIEFMNLEDPLEKEGAKVGFQEYQLPSEMPSLAPQFTLPPSESITKFGNRGVSVAWRDDVFRRPVSLAGRDGTPKKRTVLMELPPEKDGSAKPGQPGALAPSDRPPGLSDAQIRALDRIDAARSSGSITEADYKRKRRLILENKLDDAGEVTTP